MGKQLFIPHQLVKFTTDPNTYDVTVDLENAGMVSDGYHTFDELYEYRMLYNAGMANALASTYVGNGLGHDVEVVKSWRHSDGELCFGKDNYFVVVMQLSTGQVSNHYKGECWDLFKVPEVERAPEWDGHTPKQAAERLRSFLAHPQQPKEIGEVLA